MKKLYLIILVIISINLANAQTYKSFQLDVAGGLNFTRDGGGFIFGLEPSFRFNDQISLGFRWEVIQLVRASGDIDFGLSLAPSYTLNGKYYFLDENKLRFYFGAGIGAFNIRTIQFGNSGFGAGSESYIGFYPRIGFDWRIFMMILDYNVLPSSELEFIDSSGDLTTLNVRNSYLGIKIGVVLLGGKK